MIRLFFVFLFLGVYWIHCLVLVSDHLKRSLWSLSHIKGMKEYLFHTCALKICQRCYRKFCKLNQKCFHFTLLEVETPSLDLNEGQNVFKYLLKTLQRYNLRCIVNWIGFLSFWHPFRVETSIFVFHWINQNVLNGDWGWLSLLN